MKIRTRCAALLLGFAMLAVGGRVEAQALTITVTVDESGVGRLQNSGGFDSALPFSFALDPGPGGLAAAPTYGLLGPPGLVAGGTVAWPGSMRTGVWMRISARRRPARCTDWPCSRTAKSSLPASL